MRSLVLLILLTAMHVCSADEINSVIEPLGLNRDDLRQIWHSGFCEPDWSISVSPEILKDKNLLCYKGLSAGFFNSKRIDDKVVLTASSKCDAINKYYFENRASIEIKQFIDLDRSFIKKYGSSVLDAIYIRDAQFHSANGQVDKFFLKFAKELSKKGLFTLEQKASEFNGKPSVAVSGERTAKGDQLYEMLYQ